MNALLFVEVSSGLGAFCFAIWLAVCFAFAMFCVSLLPKPPEE